MRQDNPGAAMMREEHKAKEKSTLSKLGVTTMDSNLTALKNQEQKNSLKSFLKSEKVNRNPYLNKIEKQAVKGIAKSRHLTWHRSPLPVLN